MVSLTFDTEGEASAWAAKTEESIKAQKYHDPRLAMSVSFGEAVEKYLDTISSNKAVPTHMREKASAARLVEHIGTETPLGSISTAMVAQYRDRFPFRISGTCDSFILNITARQNSNHRLEKSGVATFW